MSSGVRQERTNHRPSAMSLRHRLYGKDAPMMDADFILLGFEYDRYKIKAFIEYKGVYDVNEPYIPSDRTGYQAQVRVLKDASHVQNVPSFIVFWQPDFMRFKVCPVGKIAREKLRGGAIFNEKEFVSFLYNLRNIPLPESMKFDPHNRVVED